MNPCKRMTVVAVGVDSDGNKVEAQNGNHGECKNIPGACGCVHAEVNLLEQMPNPISVFITHSPCLDCAKVLVAAGVEFVRYYIPYRLTDGIDYLIDHNVEISRRNRI